MSQRLSFAPRVGAIVVVFEPDLHSLRELVQQLATLVCEIVLVNNGAEPITEAIFSRALQDRLDSRLGTLNLGDNHGVGFALNRGVSYLAERHCNLAWSFDQDSMPSFDALAALVAAMDDPDLAAVVPVVYQEGSDHPMPFLVVDAKGCIRVRAVNNLGEVAAAITSGMLVRIDTWHTVGGALEPFFIDHVDTEWCFRARAAGWRIVAVPSACIRHQLGSLGPRFAGFGHQVVLRSPLRTYYMLRNGWLLGRMAWAPKGWFRHQRVQAIKIIAVALLHGPRRSWQWRAIFKAIRDARKNYDWLQ